MRLINADALMDDINNSLNEMTNIGVAVDGDWLWAKLNDAIEHATTIEPERKKGKWKMVLTRDAIGFNTVRFCCSECNGMDYGTPPFCRMCGAEMEGCEQE